MGFFAKIKAGLTRTKENIGHSIDQPGEGGEDQGHGFRPSLPAAGAHRDASGG